MIHETYDEETKASSFLNTEVGLHAFVTPREDGRFAVTLVDVDASVTVPMAKVFPDELDAIAYAERCVA